MKRWIFIRPPYFSSYTGRRFAPKLKMVRYRVQDLAGAGCLSSLILSHTFDLSTLAPDQDRKSSLMKEIHYVVQAT